MLLFKSHTWQLQNFTKVQIISDYKWVNLMIKMQHAASLFSRTVIVVVFFLAFLFPLNSLFCRHVCGRGLFFPAPSVLWLSSGLRRTRQRCLEGRLSFSILRQSTRRDTVWIAPVAEKLKKNISVQSNSYRMYYKIVQNWQWSQSRNIRGAL